jgi:hypothetical protein
MAKTKARVPRPRNNDHHNVFLSWSGPRSQHAALAFREWLPTVVQAARPWMSTRDIHKGTVSSLEILTKLDTCAVGVVFLTADNVTEPWINFEAGAIAKAVGAEPGRVSAFLLDGLHHTAVTGPLSLFQNTKHEEDEVRKLVTSIAGVLDPSLSEDTVSKTFDGGWPSLEAKLKEKPAAPSKERRRGQDDIMEEILGHVRALVARPPVTPDLVAEGLRQEESRRLLHAALKRRTEDAEERKLVEDKARYGDAAAKLRLVLRKDK